VPDCTPRDSLVKRPVGTLTLTAIMPTGRMVTSEIALDLLGNASGRLAGSQEPAPQATRSPRATCPRRPRASTTRRHGRAAPPWLPAAPRRRPGRPALAAPAALPRGARRHPALLSTHRHEDTWTFVRHPDRRIHLDVPEMLEALRPDRGNRARRHGASTRSRRSGAARGTGRSSSASSTS
jgi:hypothetical protein